MNSPCNVVINGDRLRTTERPWLGIISSLFCFVHADWLRMHDFYITLMTSVSCNYPPHTRFDRFVQTNKRMV